MYKRQGDTAAVQVDGSGGSVHIDELRNRGVEVVEIPVYEWRLPEDRRPAIRLAEGVIARRVHAVTFTTGPAVRNWLDIVAEVDLGGDRADAAQHDIAAGLPEELLVVPAAWRLGPLVRAVADRLAERTLRLDVRGVPMSIAGTAVTIGGAEVTLSDIEARVLATLAARPNIVFTKAEILQAVWGDGGLDPHAVEVAVARLRRRLGPPGDAVTSVHRRGYALRA